jgi:hypothetical protein
MPRRTGLAFAGLECPLECRGCIPYFDPHRTILQADRVFRDRVTS